MINFANNWNSTMAAIRVQTHGLSRGIVRPCDSTWATILVQTHGRASLQWNRTAVRFYNQLAQLQYSNPFHELKHKKQ